MLLSPLMPPSPFKSGSMGPKRFLMVDHNGYKLSVKLYYFKPLQGKFCTVQVKNDKFLTSSFK